MDKSTTVIFLNCLEAKIELLLDAAETISENSKKTIETFLKNKVVKPSVTAIKPIRIEINTALYKKLKKEFPKYRVSTVLNCIYVLYVEKRKLKETDYGKILFQKSQGWQRELRTEAGNIDGINYSSKRLIELKFVDGWKSALGQALAYKSALNLDSDFSIEIWLLFANSQIDRKKFSNIESFCNKHAVSAFFLNIDRNLEPFL